jgi:prolyl-tRNA editing enzyme YbaK/EbsC (Cys-tRNA(Pro) deacylase)
LGVSRLSLATSFEVKEITGCEIGTVNPFGLPQSIRHLADKSVFIPGEISIGCGVPGSAIILKTSDLLRALASVEIGLFSEIPTKE